MSQRPNPYALSPEFVRKYSEFSMALKKSTIEAKLQHLIEIRASQINGCAFCVDMHSKEAKIAGERELRLYHLPIWRESPLFSDRERAALEWTEVLTRLPEHGVPDAIYDAVRAHLSDKEIADLTFSVMVINGWNRLSIAFQAVPGSQDAAFGLTKANLS